MIRTLATRGGLKRTWWEWSRPGAEGGGIDGQHCS